MSFAKFWLVISKYSPGPLAQSVMCLTADTGVASSIQARSHADPGVESLINARSHTFVEIDHEIISTVFFLLLLIQEGLLSVTSESMHTKYWLTA